jgi:two-component system LytT family sensor kinase
VKVYMRQREKKLVFQVQNSFDPEKTTRHKGHGIGLENVRRRLSIMYPNRHEFRVLNQPEKQLFTCDLEIWQ